MKNKSKKNPGCGNGPHHEVSPMGHGTRTKSKQGKRRAADQKQKQRGWA